MNNFGLKFENVYYKQNKHDDFCHGCRNKFDNFHKIIIIYYLEENSIYLCYKCSVKLKDKLANMKS